MKLTNVQVAVLRYLQRVWRQNEDDPWSTAKWIAEALGPGVLLSASATLNALKRKGLAENNGTWWRITSAGLVALTEAEVADMASRRGLSALAEQEKT